MKKIIALLLFAVAGVVTAQIPQEAQITQAQLEQSERTAKRRVEFKDKINKKVDAIMTAGNIDSKYRSALEEIVSVRESKIVRIYREDSSTADKQTKIEAVKENANKQLKQLLGDKYSTVMAKLKS